MQDGERTVTLRRVGDTADVIVRRPRSGAGQPRRAAIDDLLADVFDKRSSGRLYKALVETKKCGVGRRTRRPTAREPGPDAAAGAGAENGRSR